MPKNKLSDLNDHLFAQLERLSDEELKGNELLEEMERAKTITNLAREIISNGNLVLKVQIAVSEELRLNTVPKMFDVPKIETKE